MRIHTIESGFFKLDGGAMFGVVPKIIWNKLNPADDDNLCTWAMRCLLIEDGDKKILIDTGIGNKQSERFFSHYKLHGQDSLIKSLKSRGIEPHEITDVILTHLHFDHVGGAVIRDSEGNLKTLFQNAIYWTNEKHWNSSIEPNPRERASFLTENIEPLMSAHQLEFIDESRHESYFSNIDFLFVHGHTESMMLPRIHHNQETILYCADLLPSSHHLHIPYVMAYDVKPLESLKEKQEILNLALEEEYTLFFEHDKLTEAGKIDKNLKGRYILREKLSF